MDNRQATLELGTKPVGKLLAQYALPAIIAMTASSLYNMIDSIFIGQGVGALAISGLAITFPLMNLSAAFGAAVGIGSSTCISVKLGQKDYKMAEHIFGNSFTLNLVVGIAFGLITLLFLDPILYFFGASENTIPYARDYMLVMFFTMSLFSLYMPRWKCKISSWLLNSLICHSSATSCDRMVASAAPCIPMPIGQMKIGASTMLSMTVSIVAAIACLGLLAARSTAFMPRNVCDTTLPARITSM